MKQGKYTSDNGRRLLGDAIPPLMEFAETQSDATAKHDVAIMVYQLKKLIKERKT